MNGIKNMLLGIAIMLAVIVFHLFCANDGLWTDFTLATPALPTAPQSAT